MTNQIAFNDGDYGSPSYVVVLTADTWLALRDRIRERRWRRNGDNPGQMYAMDCKLLHVAKTDAGPSAVCLVTQYYDV